MGIQRPLLLVLLRNWSAGRCFSLVNKENGSLNHPNSKRLCLEIDATEAEQLTLRIRIPFWCQGDPVIVEDEEFTIYFYNNMK